MFSSSQEEHCAPSKDPVKYGELVVLGWVSHNHMYFDIISLCRGSLSERQSESFEEDHEEVSQQDIHVAPLATWQSLDIKAWLIPVICFCVRRFIYLPILFYYYPAQPISYSIKRQQRNPPAHVTPRIGHVRNQKCETLTGSSFAVQSYCRCLFLL